MTSNFELKIKFSFFFKLACKTACFFWTPQNMDLWISRLADQRPIGNMRYQNCRMFYDTRTIHWDNFEILTCTHQAHFEHFWRINFWVDFFKPTGNLGWPIYCAWWVQIKKNFRWPENKYISPASLILTRRKPFPATVGTTIVVNGVQKRPQKKISYVFRVDVFLIPLFSAYL